MYCYTGSDITYQESRAALPAGTVFPTGNPAQITSEAPSASREGQGDHRPTCADCVGLHEEGAVILTQFSSLFIG